MPTGTKRWINLAWCALILGFAALHALHLRADFPNHSPWMHDWAKYTDEGWYGNAAIRAHLFGNWYLPGDFNPAVAVPVWPFLEWVLFFFTGVTIEAARGLAVAFFFANLLLSYLLLRSARAALDGAAGGDAAGDQSLSLLLQPAGDSGADADHADAGGAESGGAAAADSGGRCGSVGIGLLFTLMMLTKTTAVFLLPALGWAMLVPLWHRRERLRCVCAAAAAQPLLSALVCGWRCDPAWGCWGTTNTSSSSITIPNRRRIRGHW